MTNQPKYFVEYDEEEKNWDVLLDEGSYYPWYIVSSKHKQEAEAAARTLNELAVNVFADPPSGWLYNRGNDDPTS